MRNLSLSFLEFFHKADFYRSSDSNLIFLKNDVILSPFMAFIWYNENKIIAIGR